MKLTITAITITATITKNTPTRTLPSRVSPDSGFNYREARHYYNDRCKWRVFRSTNACTCGSYTLGDTQRYYSQSTEVRRVDPKTIVVMEGDQTGQELLEEALRVLDPAVTGLGLDFVRYDLSLENRRATD